MCLNASQFFIQALVIHHVVPVLAPRRSLEVRRTVDMRNPEIVKILCDPGCILEIEFPVQLKPVRGHRYLGLAHISHLQPFLESYPD